MGFLKKIFTLIVIFLFSKINCSHLGKPVSDDGTCYIACYTHLNRGTPVGGGINVIGQFPVLGYYNKDGVCLPTGYENEDISALIRFKNMCGRRFNCPGLTCWAGGKTR